MKSYVITAFLMLSGLFERLARRCGYQPLPQQTVQLRINIPEMLALGRAGLLGKTENEVNDALRDRKRTGRNQVEDNKLLAPLSWAINEAIRHGDYRLSAEVFRDNYARILAYEKQDPPCEVHKGALAFDVARAYLRGWDFFAAMHYFELAQLETRLTDNNPDFIIYNFDLFAVNFWDAVDVDTVKHPLPIYQEFWGIPYNKQNALDDYAEMSVDSKLSYIIASAERVRLQQIADHSGWEGSDALRLGYWTLATDIARFLEVETKLRFKTAAGAGPADTLLACLEQGFHTTPIGDVSKEVAVEIPKRYPRKEPPGGRTPSKLYEDHFDAILAEIRDPKKKREDRIYLSLYLLGFTRNQIAHKIDLSSKLFQQLDDARFLVDLFLTLCRTKEWRGL